MPRPKKATRYANEYKGKYSFALTSTAVQRLDEMASTFQISRSELVEKIGRGELTVSPTSEQVGELLAS